MELRHLMTEFSRGMAAGAAGTAALTAVQRVEMQIEDRPPSTAPAEAVEKVFDFDVEREKDEVRLAHAVHWGYGTLWGGVRGLLGGLGMSAPTATAVHFALVTGAAMTIMPALDLAEPPTEWSKKDLAIDLLHHAVYAVATAAAYEGLRRATANGNGNGRS